MKQIVQVSKDQELNDRLLEYLGWIYPDYEIEILSGEEDRPETPVSAVHLAGSW